MSNGLKALVDLKNIYSFYENPKEALEDLGRMEFFREIRDFAKTELESYLEGYIEYFVDCEPDKDWISGIENKEHFLREVEEWNNSCVKRAVCALKKMEELKSKHGFTDLSELVAYYETTVGEGDDCYESYRYYLKQALVELEGNFEYGNYRIVIDASDGSSSFSTRIKKETLECIRKNPENYAIIYLYYK